MARARITDKAGHGGDVHHMPRAPRPHAGQDRARHGEQAEHVGVEHGAYLAVVTLLHRCLVAITGVVDQHVDTAEAPDRSRHGRGDLRVVGDIQVQHQAAVAMALRQVGHPALVACRQHGARAARQHTAGEFAAEAGGASGDEPDRGISGGRGHADRFLK